MSKKDKARAEAFNAVRKYLLLTPINHWDECLMTLTVNAKVSALHGTSEKVYRKKNYVH